MTASELTVENATLKEQIKNFRHDLDTLIHEFRDVERGIDRLQNEYTALRTVLESHIKLSEKWDNRIWTMIGLFIGSVLALAGTLIVNALKR